ncbi:O-antigen ligase family protein [Microbacterium sp. X-17]|uniref:O-antigen ligase family protein n=1 Tax=Microbacterium sp. X-17 TaxID=3144404 RepID=UPI0031F5A106
MTQAAVLAALLGAVLWGSGVLLGGSLGLKESSRHAEFWWVLLAIFTGGFTTLSNIGVLNLSIDGVTYLRTLPLIAVGLLMVFSTLRKSPVIPSFAFFLVPVFLIMFAFVVNNQVLMTLLSLLTFLPVLVVPKGGYSFVSVRAGALVGTLVLLIALGGWILVDPNGLIGPCRGDKCSVWGVALGPYGLGNALGMVLAVVAAITILLSSRVIGIILCVGGSYLLVNLTSTRTGELVWIAGVVVAIVYWLTLATSRLWLVRIAALVSAGVVIVWPFLGWTGDAFTGRGALWIYAKQLVLESPWFGYGSSFWVGNSASDAVDRNYSTHNLTTEMLVSVGIIGSLALLIAMLLALARRRSIRVAALTASLFSLTFLASLTEVFSAPGRVYLMAGLIVLLFLVSESTIVDAAAAAFEASAASSGRRRAGSSMRSGRPAAVSPSDAVPADSDGQPDAVSPGGGASVAAADPAF